MGYFDDEPCAEAYIKMCEGYDGAELVQALGRHLSAGATVLELGMGPGKDLELLAQRYTVTGSDTSQYFIDRYRAAHPDADLLLLDAVAMETERTFDALYSNKVLHHLTREDLVTSLRNQAERLNPGGILLHSFWRGSKEEHHHGLRFIYYEEEELRALIADYELLWVEHYKEMELDDSIFVVAQRPGDQGGGVRLA